MRILGAHDLPSFEHADQRLQRFCRDPTHDVRGQDPAGLQGVLIGAADRRHEATTGTDELRETRALLASVHLGDHIDPVGRQRPDGLDDVSRLRSR